MTAVPAQIPERPAPRELSQLAGHVVICNCNPKVRSVVNELMRITAPAPLDVVLLVQDEPLWRAHPEWHPDPAHADHFFPLVGNPADPAFLERSRMAHARTAMILADPNQAELADARSTLVAIAIEHHSPQVHTVIELVSTLNRPHLASTEVDEVVCGDDIAQKLLAQSCITPGVVNIFRRLLRPDLRRPLLLRSASLPAALQAAERRSARLSRPTRRPWGQSRASGPHRRR